MCSTETLKKVCFWKTQLSVPPELCSTTYDLAKVENSHRIIGRCTDCPGHADDHLPECRKFYSLANKSDTQLTKLVDAFDLIETK